jgi:hypothetical protein
VAGTGLEAELMGLVVAGLVEEVKGGPDAGPDTGLVK